MAADLHVTSPPMRGPAVLAIQEKLEALGYAPGTLDGMYGETTASAVRAFQRDNGLEVDGVIGPKTRQTLRKVRKPARRRPLARQASSIGEAAVVEALKHVGKKERPHGSNKTEFGRWFGVDAVPWCNTFVSFCFANGAKYVICAGFRGAGVYRNGCTYVPTTEAWLRATGMWKGKTTPMPGDIAIFNWDGGVPDHIGIVEENLGGGTFHCLEGNTSVGNDSNGGQVMRRLRYLSQVNGFGRVVK